MKPRVVRVLFVCLLALPRPVAVAAAEFDWCAPIVTRPLARWSDPAQCVPKWSDAEIAAGADWVLLGGSELPEAVAAGEADRCGPATSRAGHAAWISRVRAAVPEGQAGPRFVLLTRFDLVGARLARRDGFHPSFLAATARQWTSVLDFFRLDASPDCAKGCRLRTTGGDAAELAARIDALSEPGRAGRVVHYLDRSAPGKRAFAPTRALAQLREPEYRAWRVAQAKRVLTVGGYDAVQLNQKFFQYRAGPGGSRHWIGGPGAETVTEVNARRDTLWTAPPVDYGYGRYVRGWHALARDLVEAGVPYVVTLGPGAWSGAADDPTTASDEAAMIRTVARGAAGVLLESGGRRSAAIRDAMTMLGAAGVPFTRFDSSCGRPGARHGAPE